MLVQVGAGSAGLVITAALMLVRIAIGAERRRADDWRTAAQTTAEANAVLVETVGKLAPAVERQAAAQDRMMALLQVLVRDRSAA